MQFAALGRWGMGTVRLVRCWDRFLVYWAVPIETGIFAQVFQEVGPRDTGFCVAIDLVLGPCKLLVMYDGPITAGR